MSSHVREWTMDNCICFKINIKWIKNIFEFLKLCQKYKILGKVSVYSILRVSMHFTHYVIKCQCVKNKSKVF